MACCPRYFKPVTHVIFDLDGLLLDSERLYTECTQNILTQYGIVFERSTKEQLMGLTSTESAKQIVKLLDLPIDWKEYHDQFQEQIKVIMPRAQLMPDSESVYKTVITKVLTSYGHKYTNDLKTMVVGTTDKDGCKFLVDELHLPLTWEELFEQIKDGVSPHLKGVPLMPGAERLIRHLHAKSIPMAVATSSSDPSYELKTEVHKPLFRLFSHVVKGGTDPDVNYGKPAPDIFLVCAKRFKDDPKPEKCLVFEDAPQGVRGAIAAGMQCVMIPEKGIDYELTKQATVLLDSMEQFVPEVFGLPPYDH